MATFASSRGHPSKGCTKCRSRKIKCDQGRPACQRCVKIGHVACAYRDDFEIILRDQTSQTAERAQEKWRSRSKKAQSSSSSPGAELAASSSSGPGSPDSAQALENPIVQRFFYDWVVPAGDSDDLPASRFMEFLPDMYQQALGQPGSPLPPALLALAYANYAQRCKSTESLPLAMEYCNEAFHCLHLKFQQALELDTEETLIAIQLLSLYEMMVNPEISTEGSYWGHIKGQATVTRLHVLQSAHPSIRITLLAIIMKQMLITCLSRAVPPSLPSSVVHLFIPRNSIPAKNHWELQYKIASMLPEWKTSLLDFLNSPAENVEKVCSFIAQGSALDKELEGWARDLPPEMGYSIKLLNKQSLKPCLWPLLETSWTPRCFHECSSLLLEHKWREWWMVRVTVIQAILQSVIHLESRGYTKQTWPDCIANYSRTETEHTLLNVLDGLVESMIAILTRPLRNKPEAKDVSEICSLRGYMILPALATAHKCLIQTDFAGIDMKGRREWCAAACDFVKSGLGFVKAGAITSKHQTEPLNIQCWSLANEAELN